MELVERQVKIFNFSSKKNQLIKIVSGAFNEKITAERLGPNIFIELKRAVSPIKIPTKPVIKRLFKISIDDFYYDAFNLDRSMSGNPWGAPRGLPGSHDLALLSETIFWIAGIKFFSFNNSSWIEFSSWFNIKDSFAY